MENSMNTNAIQRRTTDILRDTACEIASALSALASNPGEGVLSAGRIFQGWVKRRGVEQLWKELDSLIKKGKIKDDYDKTPQFKDCLLELLRFLDNDCPDEVRFQTLKKIFLVAATETVSDRKSFLPYEYMKMCRSMSSGEILVMQTAYSLHIEKQTVSFSDPHFEYNWINSIRNKGGFQHMEIVDIYKKRLIDKEILQLAQDHPAQLSKNSSNGLTSLGLALCKYIESYKEDDNNGVD